MTTLGTREPVPPAGGEEEAYFALHAERAGLERDLNLAQARRRFGPEAGDAAAAEADEGRLLRELDRILTLIRAAEYKRRPGARRW